MFLEFQEIVNVFILNNCVSNINGCHSRLTQKYYNYVAVFILISLFKCLSSVQLPVTGISRSFFTAHHAYSSTRLYVLFCFHIQIMTASQDRSMQAT